MNSKILSDHVLGKMKLKKKKIKVEKF